MGATGSYFDHASPESIWALFNQEYFYRHRVTTIEELRAGVAHYISFSNPQRRRAKARHLGPIRYGN